MYLYSIGQLLGVKPNVHPGFEGETVEINNKVKRTSSTPFDYSKHSFFK